MLDAVLRQLRFITITLLRAALFLALHISKDVLIRRYRAYDAVGSFAVTTTRRKSSHPFTSIASARRWASPLADCRHAFAGPLFRLQLSSPIFFGTTADSRLVGTPPPTRGAGRLLVMSEVFRLAVGHRYGRLYGYFAQAARKPLYAISKISPVRPAVTPVRCFNDEFIAASAIYLRYAAGRVGSKIRDSREDTKMK